VWLLLLLLDHIVQGSLTRNVVLLVMDWRLLLGMERGHLQWELLRDHTACHVSVH